MDKDQYDSLILRCPSLGGDVPFQYCRRMNQGTPCSRLPVCWAERFDIVGYIKRFYSAEEINQIFFSKGHGRLAQIIDNLERVERMKKEDENRDALIDAIRKETTDGKITCARAWLLADQFGYPKREMGTLLNELKVKLIQCQLGCF